MNAMAEPQAFTLPKKPKIRQQEPPPDQRKVAVVPIRALTDDKLTDGAFRVLAMICSYCNRAGLTWVSQKKLAEDAKVTRQAITNQLAKLRAAGYIEVVKKGWRGESTNTLRVIFDPSVDTDTAIAVTSSQEPTRPAHMEEPDLDGQKRIAQLISKALKKPPTKEYTMPKSGQSITVQKMHEEIAKAKAKRSKPVDKPVDQSAYIGHPPVSNESSPKVSNEGLHRQPGGHSGVSLNTGEHSIRQSISKDSFKDLKTVLGNRELRKAGMTDQQIATSLEHLLAAYRAEGLTPNPDRLTTEILQLHRDTNR
jgi:biotin operon repressor